MSTLTAIRYKAIIYEMRKSFDDGGCAERISKRHNISVERFMKAVVNAYPHNFNYLAYADQTSISNILQLLEEDAKKGYKVTDASEKYKYKNLVTKDEISGPSYWNIPYEIKKNIQIYGGRVTFNYADYKVLNYATKNPLDKQIRTIMDLRNALNAEEVEKIIDSDFDIIDHPLYRIVAAEALTKLEMDKAKILYDFVDMNDLSDYEVYALTFVNNENIDLLVKAIRENKSLFKGKSYMDRVLVSNLTYFAISNGTTEILKTLFDTKVISCNTKFALVEELDLGMGPKRDLVEWSILTLSSPSFKFLTKRMYCRITKKHQDLIRKLPNYLKSKFRY